MNVFKLSLFFRTLQINDKMTDKYESSSPQEGAIVLQEIVLFFWASSSMLLTINRVTQWLYRASDFSLIVPLKKLTLLQPFVKSYSVVWRRTRHNVCVTKLPQPHNSVEVSKPKNCLLSSGNQHLHISSSQALTSQQVKSSTSCERPHTHPSALLFISDVWRRAAENVSVLTHDWQSPLLRLSPPGSRHFCPVPVFVADPTVKHVHIYRQGSNVGDTLNSERGWA